MIDAHGYRYCSACCFRFIVYLSLGSPELSFWFIESLSKPEVVTVHLVGRHHYCRR